MSSTRNTKTRGKLAHNADSQKGSPPQPETDNIETIEHRQQAPEHHPRTCSHRTAPHVFCTYVCRRHMRNLAMSARTLTTAGAQSYRRAGATKDLCTGPLHVPLGVGATHSQVGASDSEHTSEMSPCSIHGRSRSKGPSPGSPSSGPGSSHTLCAARKTTSAILLLAIWSWSTRTHPSMRAMSRRPSSRNALSADRRIACTGRLCLSLCFLHCRCQLLLRLSGAAAFVIVSCWCKGHCYLVTLLATYNLLAAATFVSCCICQLLLRLSAAAADLVVVTYCSYVYVHVDFMVTQFFLDHGAASSCKALARVSALKSWVQQMAVKGNMGAEWQASGLEA